MCIIDKIKEKFPNSHILLEDSCRISLAHCTISVPKDLSARAIIVIDPNSAELKQLVEQCRLAFPQTASVQKRLEYIAGFVRTCFDGNHDAQQIEKVKQAEQAWRMAESDCIDFQDKKIPLIPLEYYIQRRVAVCVQITLLQTFLINRLMSAEMAYYHRAVVSSGTAHAWTLYVVDQGLQIFFVDTTRLPHVLVLDFSGGLVNRLPLEQCYGCEIVGDIIQTYYTRPCTPTASYHSSQGQ